MEHVRFSFSAQDEKYRSKLKIAEEKLNNTEGFLRNEETNTGVGFSDTSKKLGDEMSNYEPKIVSQEIKRVIDFPLHPIAQLVHGKDTPANFSLFDIEIAPTAPGAPPHTHSFEDEVYYILEGEMTFMMDDKIETAREGSAIILPRGLIHATWNENDKPAKALTFISQDSKFEHFFDDVVERIRRRGINDPVGFGQVVAESGVDYGVTVDMTAMPDRAKPFFGIPTTI
jgi:mannose-6-phosphate isomerase-like protein (cupin superfamily)